MLPGQPVLTEGVRGSRAVFALRGEGAVSTADTALWDFSLGMVEGEACLLGGSYAYTTSIEAKSLMHVVSFSRQSILEAFSRSQALRKAYDVPGRAWTPFKSVWQRLTSVFE